MPVEFSARKESAIEKFSAVLLVGIAYVKYDWPENVGIVMSIEGN